MLIAIDSNKCRYLSTDPTTIHREKGFYLCQECKQPVFLRLCLNKISHFAHYPDDKQCTGAWEPDTEIHSFMKKDVYEYFKKFSWVKKIEIEYPIEIEQKIYLPDIYIETINNHKIAVECQAHKTTRDLLLQRAYTYANAEIYPLFILESNEFIREFVSPRDDLYISPRFEEKDNFIQRFYIYDNSEESIQKYIDIIHILDVEFAKIPSNAIIGTYIDNYDFRPDFDNYKINFSKVKYPHKDELFISEIPMVVDMQIPRFNFQKIEKLKDEEELRERLRQQALIDKKKEEELAIIEEEIRRKREEELQRKREKDIRNRQELRRKEFTERLQSIDVDEPWALYANLPRASNSILLDPLTWQGGDQVSNLRTMLTFFKKFYIPDKTKMMIYKSCPGSGKSATLLHVIRGMGRGIIVTPFKALQRQYYDDYFKGNKFVMKKDGTRLKVAVILGRGNFPCRWLAEQYDYQQKLIEESKKPENVGVYFHIDDFILNLYRQDPSAANRKLPCTRPLKLTRSGRREPRWLIGSQCPYWIPTPTSKTTIDKWQEKVVDERKNLEEEFYNTEKAHNADEGLNIPDIEKNIPSITKTTTQLDTIKDRVKCSTIKYYDSVAWGEVGVFIRDDVDKDGNKCPSVCPYYEQFYSYIDADVIVMNSAKWHLETMIGRKPLTDLEVFDEGDYWLDNLSAEIEFPRYAIDKIVPTDNKVKRLKSRALELFDMSIKDIKSKIGQKRKTGDGDINIIDAKYYKELFAAMTNTLAELIKSLEDDERLEGKIVDMLTTLKYIDKASISFREGNKEENKIIKILIPYPDNVLKDLFRRSSQNIIITSGTMHKNSVLSSLFGINADNYIVEILEGRKKHPGRLYCIKAPKGHQYVPIKVTHNSWKNSPQFVEHYNKILNYILDNLKIHVDKRTASSGKAKILVLTSAKKYAKGIRNRPDVYTDFAKDDEEDNMSIKIDTTLGDYVDKTLEDIRSIKKDDINLDGNVLRTDKQIILSTRMIRGVDLRDNLCRGIVVLKWPIPDTNAEYNQALKQRFGNDIFWSIMHDKAERETIQYVSRGLRYDLDWCLFSSPDDKAFNNVIRLFGIMK